MKDDDNPLKSDITDEASDKLTKGTPPANQIRGTDKQTDEQIDEPDASRSRFVYKRDLYGNPNTDQKQDRSNEGSDGIPIIESVNAESFEQEIDERNKKRYEGREDFYKFNQPIEEPKQNFFVRYLIKPIVNFFKNLFNLQSRTESSPNNADGRPDTPSFDEESYEEQIEKSRTNTNMEDKESGQKAPTSLKNSQPPQNPNASSSKTPEQQRKRISSFTETELERDSNRNDRKSLDSMIKH